MAPDFSNNEQILASNQSLTDHQVMTPDVTGLCLEEAQRRLRDAGACVFIVEYSSRKGVQNSDERRVIRQRIAEDGAHELTVCDFRTTAGE